MHKFVDGNNAAFQTKAKVGGWWDSDGARLVLCLVWYGKLISEMTVVWFELG